MEKMEIVEVLARYAGMTTKTACAETIANMSETEKVDWLLNKIERLATCDMYARLKGCEIEYLKDLFMNTIE